MSITAKALFVAESLRISPLTHIMGKVLPVSAQKAFLQQILPGHPREKTSGNGTPPEQSSGERMQDDKALRLILRQARTIAVIGAKDKPEQPVDRVGRYLLKQGYRIFPVHPVRTQAWGLPVFTAVTEIREPIDIVVLFRASHFCPAHAAEVASLDSPPSAFWMQTGIRSPESRQILSNSTTMIVEDACIMVEHARLTGNKDQGCAHGS